MPQSSKLRRPYYANADSEVATSNSTVNAFMGGRQPSWMVNTTPVKPTPRPKPMRQHLQQAPAQSSTNVLPSPAPSDEPSPAVSNPQDSPNPQSAALPEYQTQDTVSMNASTPGGMPVTESRFAPDVNLTSQHYIQNYNVNGNIGTGPAQAMPNESSAVAPTAPSRHPSSGRLVHPMHSLQSPQLASPSAYVTSPPIPPSNAQSPSSATAGTQAWTTLPLDPVAAERNAKRRKLTTPTTLQLDQRLKLDAYAGNQKLTDIEHARFQILRDACGKGDSFYLAFHQIFCLWSVSRQDAYSYLKISPTVVVDTGFVDTGFKILETVLKGNDYVSSMNLRFFIEFPWPLNILLAGSGRYSEAVTQVAIFLQSLPNNWPGLLNGSFSRGFPYLVDELLQQLQCPSTVLQTILFTASRRRLGVRDGPLGMEIDQLFRRDQAARLTSSGEFKAVGYVMYGTEWERINSGLINEYRRIVQTSRQGEPPRRVSGFQPAHLQSTDPNLSPAHIASQQWARRQSIPQGGHAPVHHQIPNNNTAFRPQLPGSQVFISSPTQQTDLPQFNQYGNYSRNPGLQSAHTSPPLPLPPGNPVQAGDRNPYQTQNHHSAQFNGQYQVQVRHPSQGSPTGFVNGTMAAPWQMMAPQNGTSQIVGTAVVPGGPGQTFPTLQQHPSMQPQAVLQRPMHTTPTGIHGRLLPPKGFEIPRNEHASSPNERKSLIMSLHQADVQSPARIRRGNSNTSERYYQAVRSVAMSPVRLDPNLYLQDIEFYVSEEDFALCCKPRKVPGSVVPVSEYFDGSLRYRLRCCKQNTGQAQFVESDWVTLEVSWPKNIWMKLNDQPLSVRRKPHNGKDLPIELTLLIKPGKNLLRIAATLPKPHKGCWYYMAVDIVECLSHSRIVESIRKRGVLKEEDTLNKIKSRLQSAPSDDDIEISNEDLKITLADPWSFSIFTTPVRGMDCTHLECFDLENWLQTRPPSKPSTKCSHEDGVACKCLKAKEPSHADKWKCPICDKDARPKSLRVDSFLLGVRRRLELDGKLGVKAILVAPNCDWRPELNDSDDEDDISDEEKDGAAGTAAPRKSTSAPPSRAPNVQVIELLDDD